jgi:hypothetical protein
VATDALGEGSLMAGWKRVGAGQDTPDAMWDKYQAREVQGAGALPTFPPHELGWDPRGMGTGGEGGMGAGGRYVGNDWHEELPSTSPADQNQGNNVPVNQPAPSSGGGGGGGGSTPAPSGGGGGGPQNTGPVSASSAQPLRPGEYGDNIYMTPNGERTGTQIAQELGAAGWDGKGDPVQVYNQTAAAAYSGSGKPPASSNAPTTAADGTKKLGIDPGAEAALANDGARIRVDADRARWEHEDRVAKIEADLKISGDQLAYNREVLAEDKRWHDEQAAIAYRKQDFDLKMAQLDSDTKIRIQDMVNVAAKELEAMKEAHAIEMEIMQEGHKILMEQGQEAFKDWQTRQSNLMNILGSALKNPWLQQLSGMAPPGREAGIMGGGNIQALLQKILAPYDYSQVLGGKAPAQTDALNQYAGAAAGGSPAGPGQETYAPSYGDWQSWSPFKKAAYRTDIEALGPGAWETQQQAAQNRFTAEGGSPDITPLAGLSASPLQSIGQQMTANMFGQTTDQWQKGQARQWSQAQAPQVKQTLRSGVAAQQGPAGATPESQLGI